MNDWPRVRLGDLIRVKHGFPFKSAQFTEEPADFLLTPGNFLPGGGLTLDSKKFYAGPVDDEYILEPGAMLVVMTDLARDVAILGFPARVPEAGDSRFLHNQRLGLVELRDPARIDRNYLYYLLCSPPYRAEILATATGTTVHHTAPRRIENFEFSLPPMRVQRQIGRVLKVLDDKIELNRKMNRTLESMAHAIFRSWFVDFGPVVAKADGREPFGMDVETAALFPDRFVDSELGRIPEGWEATVVREVFELTAGQSPPGSTYNKDGEGVTFYQGRADFGGRFPSRRVYCTEPKRFAQPGDTLVSVRAPVGDTNQAWERCAIGRGVAAVRSKVGAPSFTYYAMRSLAPEFARFEGSGSVFGSISQRDFKRLPVVASGPELVRAFEAFVGPMDALMLANLRESRTLAELRDLLLPKLLSGEVRVPEAEEMAAGVT